MKHMYAIALSVARTRSLPPPPVVPATYGEMLSALQRELGLTDREMAKLAGRKGGVKDQTMYRLRNGTGSVKSAIAVRDVLLKRGKVVPPLPIAGVDQATRVEPWLKAWIELGTRLHDHASEEQFAKCFSDVRDLVEALERVSHHMAAISQPGRR